MVAVPAESVGKVLVEFDKVYEAKIFYRRDRFSLQLAYALVGK
jgi:hypothetical protein